MTIHEFKRHHTFTLDIIWLLIKSLLSLLTLIWCLIVLLILRFLREKFILCCIIGLHLLTLHSRVLRSIWVLLLQVISYISWSFVYILSFMILSKKLALCTGGTHYKFVILLWNNFLNGVQRRWHWLFFILII